MEGTALEYAIAGAFMIITLMALREVWRSTDEPDTDEWNDEITEADAADVADSWSAADERAAEQEMNRRDSEGPDPAADDEANDDDETDNRGGRQWDGIHPLSKAAYQRETIHPGSNRFKVARQLAQSGVPLYTREIADEIPELTQKQVSNALVGLRRDNEWAEIRNVSDHNAYSWVLTNSGQAALERGFDLLASNDWDGPDEADGSAEAAREAEQLIAEIEGESDPDPTPANDDRTNWERARDRYGLARDE